MFTHLFVSLQRVLKEIRIFMLLDLSAELVPGLAENMDGMALSLCPYC